jgi:hypothetical protein
MLRTTTIALVLAVAGCHHDPQPMHAKPGDLPPLPPASGTPVGYLIDAAGELQLRDDQLTKLKDIDTSLAARDASIDTQLRQIERPEEEEQDPKATKKRHHNNAPGGPPTSRDAAKLHDLRNANDRDALTRAWALLEPAQQSTAKRILEDRGVEVPGTAAKKPTGDGTQDGTPVPLEP